MPRLGWEKPPGCPRYKVVHIVNLSFPAIDAYGPVPFSGKRQLFKGALYTKFRRMFALSTVDLCS